jgi:hypothetical protein
MSEILTPQTAKTADMPVANFAKKEKVDVPAEVVSEMRVQIPPIYYWEDVVEGVSVMMTMAFRYRDGVYGQSYPIEDANAVKINMLRKKLFDVVKESLDVLVHHGTKVLDKGGNIDPRKVNDEEALRFKYDKTWDKKVAAFNQLVRIAPITQVKARELKLL